MVFLTLIRVVLAAIFVTAAVGKLWDLPGSGRAMEDFGVPARFAVAAGIALPVLELAIAAALLVTPVAGPGAVGAFALLAMFVVVIARTLRRGEAPDCNCFGQVHSAPAGWNTLWRNLLLAGLAGVVILAGNGPSASAWIANLGGLALAALLGGLVLAMAIAIQTWFLLGLLRQHGRLIGRIERLEQAQGAAGPAAAITGSGKAGEPRPAGLPDGTKAPDFALEGVGANDPVTRDGLLAAGRPLVLIFSDPDCGACSTLLPDLAGWQRDRSDTFTVALLMAGSSDEHRAQTEEHGVRQILLDPGREVARSYGAKGTPAAVLVDVEGRIASPLARGAGEVRLLAGRVAQGEERIVTTGSASSVWAVGKGARLPSVPLNLAPGAERSSRRDVDLSSASGQRRVVVFWHGHCPYCQRMVSDLRAWEKERPADAPELFLVTAEPISDDPALALSIPLLEDTDGQIVRAAGARSTPTALLLDQDGRVVSDLEVGAPAIMDLVRDANGADGRRAAGLTIVRSGE